MTNYLSEQEQGDLYNYIVYRMDDNSDEAKLELKARLAVMPKMTIEKIIEKIVAEMNIELK